MATLAQGYNRAAMEVLQEALGTVRSMGVDSGLMRSSILLKICVAQSEMKQYDAALLSCEQVRGMCRVAKGRLAD